jgi:hypothetical protein
LRKSTSIAGHLGGKEIAHDECIKKGVDFLSKQFALKLIIVVNQFELAGVEVWIFIEEQ